MKVLEAKVIYESDNIEKYKKIISDIFYDFGVTGLKIEEPLLNKDPLNFYRDEKQFLLSENSVSAYFPLNIYSEKRKKVLEETFKEKFSEDEEIVYNLDFYEYDEEDYQNSWKKYLFVEKVSEKFVVKPTWREYEKQDDELVIELDPGRAFGTGSHPTTSLLLKLMEEQDFTNKTIIDIGTGSGILMIAGKLLGAGEVYGTDIDEFSMEVAKENLLLNNISLDEVKLLKGNLLEVIENKKFDIVVCNILADVLIKLLDEIKYILKEDSIVLFSGIIEDKLAEVISKAESVGLEVAEIKEDKEWRSCRLLVKKLSQYSLILLPLLMSVIKKVDNLTLAMEARAFHCGLERTNFHRLKFQKIDYLAFIILFSIIIFLFFYK